MPDRNPKVRRRLAAGKLRLRLCDLRNLGPRSEKLLADIGIYTAEDLRRRGALEAYLELRRSGRVRSLNLLWALVGALEPWPEGRDWREVATSEARLPLLLAVDARDVARQSVLEAGGGVLAQRTSKTTGKRRRTTEKPPVWVPGLPFETSKKKNRR